MTSARAIVAAALVLFACSKDSSKADDGTPTAAATPVKTADAAPAPVAADAAAPLPAVDAAAASSDDGSKVATEPGDDKPATPEKAKNLKLLPKRWSMDKIKAEMKAYTKALGVKCDFCHDVKDYASDANKHKGDARKMIRMTRDMNKKFFKGKPEIGCRTCHHGNKEPE